MAINLIKRKKFLVVKKSKKMLQFVVQSCSIKNYVLKNLVRLLIMKLIVLHISDLFQDNYQYYSAINLKKLNSKYKCIGMQKFAKKFLEWQAVYECGERSSCFVTTRTINTEIYIKECFKKHLLPFLRSHTGNPLF